MNVQWRKSTNESQGKPEQKFDAIFRIFKEASRNFILIFVLSKTG
jgi:hypothetical protein